MSALMLYAHPFLHSPWSYESSSHPPLSSCDSLTGLVGELCPSGWKRTLRVMGGWLHVWAGCCLGHFGTIPALFYFPNRSEKHVAWENLSFFSTCFSLSFILFLPKLPSPLLLHSIRHYLPPSPPSINSVSFKWGKMACHARVWQILVVTVAVSPAWAFLKSLRDKHIFCCRRERRRGRRGR